MQELSQSRAIGNKVGGQNLNTTVGVKLFGSFTPVRVILHGLRRSPPVNRRLGGQAARSWGICHLLGE
jgi:hypothetical protein